MAVNAAKKHLEYINFIVITAGFIHV